MSAPARIAIAAGGLFVGLAVLLGLLPLSDPPPVVIGSTSYVVDCGSVFFHHAGARAGLDPCALARGGMTVSTIAAFVLAAVLFAVGALIVILDKPALDPVPTLAPTR